MLKRKLIIHAAIFLLIFAGSSFSANANSIENVFGVGIGLPYGGLGFNYEIGLTDYLAPTVGIGYLPDNLGWNAGIRLYYPGRDHNFRGRITALYGTNTLIEDRFFGFDDEYDTETGFSGGIGFNWRFGNQWAFDGDLFVSDSDVPFGYEEKGSEVLASLGFNYRW